MSAQDNINLFWAVTTAKSISHLLRVSDSVAYINKHMRCCYLSFSLSLVCNELHIFYGWHCNAFSGDFHHVQV